MIAHKYKKMLGVLASLTKVLNLALKRNKSVRNTKAIVMVVEETATEDVEEYKLSYASS